MFEFISRYCFGKKHKEVKEKALKEVLGQLANMSDESLAYVAENYKVEVDELVQERESRVTNNNRSIVYITLKEKEKDES